MGQHISYPDIASYESGISLVGMPAVVVKATEGYGYVNPDYARVAADATRRGIPWAAYHFLRRGGAVSQANWFHVHAGDVPMMLDVETAGDGTKATIDDVLAFVAELRAWGGRPRLVYLPRWYWAGLGKPDLTPLAAAGLALVSSNYPPAGYTDTGPGWEPYGGVTPTVWQYTDAHSLNGFTVDMNAYRGTIDQFRALLEGDDMLDLTQPIPSAATPDVPGRTLGDVLGDAWHGIHMDLPTQVAALTSKVDGLVTVLTTLAASGTGVDTAIVIKAINDAAAAESAAVADLRTKLAAAQQAAAAAIGAQS